MAMMWHVGIHDTPLQISPASVLDFSGGNFVEVLDLVSQAELVDLYGGSATPVRIVGQYMAGTFQDDAGNRPIYPVAGAVGEIRPPLYWALRVIVRDGTATAPGIYNTMITEEQPLHVDAQQDDYLWQRFHPITYDASNNLTYALEQGWGVPIQGADAAERVNPGLMAPFWHTLDLRVPRRLEDDERLTMYWQWPLPIVNEGAGKAWLMRSLRVLVKSA